MDEQTDQRRPDALGAVLACGDGARPSHACATALWEIRPYSGTWIHVTVPSRAGRVGRDRIRLHRSSALTRDDIATHRGMPVTTIAPTLLDVAAALAPPRLARTVEQTEIRRLFDLSAIDRTLARHPGHPGAARLRQALSGHREDVRLDAATVAATLRAALAAGPTSGAR